MKIRKAKLSDMDRILKIYAYARQFMVETGNPNQWAAQGYPKRSLLEADIEKGNLYVMEEADGIRGVFAFVIGADPTYERIDGGQWLNDRTYGTIHRIAGDGTVKGLLRQCVDFGFTLIDNIRIDTHKDNKIMQHLIEKCGFTYCGIITGSDGNPRLAYQKSCPVIEEKAGAAL